MVNTSDEKTNLDSAEIKSSNTDLTYTPWYKKNLKEILFLSCFGGASVLFGFSSALAYTKKKDTQAFDKGLFRESGTVESGGALALRALRRATIYTVSGATLVCFVVWKLMGVHSMEEFRAKVQPARPKKNEQGKSDFKTLRELFNYIMDEDRKSKEKRDDG